MCVTMYITICLYYMYTIVLLDGRRLPLVFNFMQGVCRPKGGGQFYVF